jgi:hypothetical protein
LSFVFLFFFIFFFFSCFVEIKIVIKIKIKIVKNKNKVKKKNIYLVGRIDGFPRGQRLVGIGVEIFCQILSPFPKLGIPQPFLFCTFDDFPRGQKLIGFGVEIRPKFSVEFGVVGDDDEDVNAEIIIEMTTMITVMAVEPMNHSRRVGLMEGK